MKKFIITFSTGSAMSVQGNEFSISKEGFLNVYVGSTLVASFNPAFWRSIAEG